MAEQNVTFRDLAERTGAADPTGKGLKHPYLSRMAAERERPSMAAVLLVATALEVDPRVILEYRLWEARRLLDERDPPAGVGRDAAAANLERIEQLVGVRAPAAASRAVPGPPEGSALAQLLQDVSPTQPDQPPSTTKRQARRSRPA